MSEDKQLIDRHADVLHRLDLAFEKIGVYEQLLREANCLIYEASKFTNRDDFYDRCLNWEEEFKKRRK